MALLVLKTWVKTWVVLVFRTSPAGQVGSQTFKIAMPRYGQCAWRLYLSVTLALSSGVATRYKCLEFQLIRINKFNFFQRTAGQQLPIKQLR